MASLPHHLQPFRHTEHLIPCMAQKQPKILYVEWCDACSRVGWFTKDEALNWGRSTNWIIKSIGWVVEETPEYLVLALGYSDESPHGEDMFLDVHKIPKTWIRKRRVVKI